MLVLTKHFFQKAMGLRERSLEVPGLSQKAALAYFLGQSCRRPYGGRRRPKPAVDGPCIVILAGQLSLKLPLH